MKDHIKMPAVAAVIGLGQMGGSFALGLKNALPDCEVRGWVPSESEAERCRAANAADIISCDAETVLRGADFVMLAIPIGPLIDWVKANASLFDRGCVVSDLSSIKVRVINEIRPVLAEHGVHFIGAHPMCGTEKVGIENADASTYHKTPCFLTPFCTDDPAAINIVREVWREIGATPIEVDALEHDENLARSSHVLHLTSNIATHVALQTQNPDLARVACAGAFRDTSRISAADPGMWRNTTTFNREAILKALDQTMKEVEHMRDMVQNSDWNELEDYLREGKNLRDNWWDFYQESRNI